MLRRSAKGGSEPVTSSAPLLYALRTDVPPCPTSGMTYRQSGDWSRTRTRSAAVHPSDRAAPPSPYGSVQNDLVAFLQALEHLGLDAVRDAGLDRDLPAAVVAVRVGHLDRDVAVLVVDDRGLRHQ